MNLQELIEFLNQDLSREYAHWHFYMNAGINVTGLHREEYQEFFFKQAAEEMKHIEEFGRLIVGLGGVPNTSVAPFAQGISQPQMLLKAALAMEQEVVNNYVMRISQSESLQLNGGQDAVDGKYLEIFLEDQVMASRADVDNIKELLK